MERMEALKNYYTTHNEDARLTPKRVWWNQSFKTVADSFGLTREN